MTQHELVWTAITWNKPGLLPRVKYLTKQGAQCSAPSSDKSPLKYAVYQYNIDLAKHLLQNGVALDEIKDALKEAHKLFFEDMIEILEAALKE